MVRGALSAAHPTPSLGLLLAPERAQEVARPLVQPTRLAPLAETHVAFPGQRVWECARRPYL